MVKTASETLKVIEREKVMQLDKEQAQDTQKTAHAPASASKHFGDPEKVEPYARVARHAETPSGEKVQEYARYIRNLKTRAADIANVLQPFIKTKNAKQVQTAMANMNTENVTIREIAAITGAIAVNNYKDGILKMSLYGMWTRSRAL